MSSKSLNGIYFKTTVLLAGCAAALAVIPAAGPGTGSGRQARSAGRPAGLSQDAAGARGVQPYRLTEIAAIAAGMHRARPAGLAPGSAVPAHRSARAHGRAGPSPAVRARSPAPGTVALAADAATRDATAPRQIARWLLTRRFHWQDWQFRYLNLLWSLESGWNPYASNPYSGAYGIPQAVPGDKMAAAGADWRSSARTQILWGLGYIRERYGTPQRAWQHECAFGWY